MNAHTYARSVIKQEYLAIMNSWMEAEVDYHDVEGEHSPFYEAVKNDDHHYALEIFLETLLPDANGEVVNAIHEQMNRDGISSESPEYAEIIQAAEDYLFCNDNTNGESVELFDECFAEVVKKWEKEWLLRYR